MPFKYLHYHSPIGRLSLLSSDRFLHGVFFEEHRHHVPDPHWQQDLAHPILLQTQRQLEEYFTGRRFQFELPLAPDLGTAFQQQVWTALTQIPYAQTTSYGALAQKLGKPKAVRALGAANGRNPFSIIVPCHRVLAANGDLHGYAGGLDKKQLLLDLERRILKVD